MSSPLWILFTLGFIAEKPRTLDACLAVRLPRLGFQGGAAHDATRDYLVYTRGPFLVKIPTRARRGDDKDAWQRLQVDSEGSAIDDTPSAIDVDCVNHLIFWVGRGGKSIFRADYDGTNARVILETGSNSVEGLSVDWIARTIYWSDHERARIYAATFDGRKRRVIVEYKNPSIEGRPKAVVADPAHGRLFWINHGPNNIQVADMGGRNRRVFFRGDIDYFFRPKGLTIMHDRNLLCVSDTGNYAAMYCVDMNNATNRFRVFPTRREENTWPGDIATDGDRLYWPDGNFLAKTIVKGTDLKGNEVKMVETPETKNPYSIRGIAFMRRECPIGTNLCANGNGGCKHFCFARQDGTTACAGPDASANQALSLGVSGTIGTWFRLCCVFYLCKVALVI